MRQAVDKIIESFLEQAIMNPNVVIDNELARTVAHEKASALELSSNQFSIADLRSRVMRDISIFKRPEDVFWWIGAGQPIPIPGHLLKESTPGHLVGDTVSSSSYSDSRENVDEHTQAACSTPPSTSDSSNVHETYTKRTASPTGEPASSRVFDTSSVPNGTAYIVFDTETTGFTKWDQVIQLAFEMYDDGGTPLQSYDRILLLPPKRYVPKKSTEKHKISTKIMRAYGVPAKKELLDFFRIVDEAQKRNIPVVAHNAAFDRRLLAQTAHTNWIAEETVNRFLSASLVCTMQSSKKYFLTAQGKARWPKNAELYERLIGHAPEGQLHNALVDVRVTAASFLAGKRRGWF